MSVALREVSPVLRDVAARAGDPEEWERFERQLRSVRFCRHPVRLQGEIASVDLATGERRTTFSTKGQPDDTLLKGCGNRREAVCPSCSEVYRADAFQLVAAGLRGGKGVPESVREHPLLFVTLTAPSFGPVHTRRVDGQGRALRCRPRRDGEVCEHGQELSCGEVHEEGDPRLGEPLCAGCFDYEHAVLWNAMAPELWRRTSIQVPRELARLHGCSQAALRRLVRVSYVKVAEYQRRGVLHFHLVVRLDAAGAPEEGAEAPPASLNAEMLEAAIRAAAGSVETSSPPSRPGTRRGQTRAIRWGAQLDVRRLEMGSAEEASMTAGYVAKYATKSTEAVGGLVHRVEESEVSRLRVRPHARALVAACWDLAMCPHLRALRLGRWAHAAGFRGHCFTKSRRYSTTFSRLRQAREDYMAARGPHRRPEAKSATSVEYRRFAYTGSGYRTLGDQWLAASGERRARQARRVAREELRGRSAAGASGRRAA